MPRHGAMPVTRSKTYSHSSKLPTSRVSRSPKPAQISPACAFHISSHFSLQMKMIITEHSPRDHILRFVWCDRRDRPAITHRLRRCAARLAREIDRPVSGYRYA